MPDNERGGCSARDGCQTRAARTCDEQKEVNWRAGRTTPLIFAHFFPDTFIGHGRLLSVGKTGPRCTERRWSPQKENIYRPSVPSAEGIDITNIRKIRRERETFVRIYRVVPFGSFSSRSHSRAYVTRKNTLKLVLFVFFLRDFQIYFG